MRLTPIGRRLFTNPCALPALTLGCTGASDVPVATVTRDSAGVTIVDDRLSERSARDVWRLSGAPVTQVGTVEGHSSQQFSEIVNAFRLRDGRLVIGDRGSREIRFFDPRGGHILCVGGRGEGPGEFGRLHSIDRLPGDTLVASDWPVGSLTWFDSNGEYLTNSRAGVYRPGLIGRVLADGSLLADVYPRVSYGNEIEWWAAYGETDRFRASGWFVRQHRDAERVDTIARILGEEWFRHGKWRQGLVVRPLPFALTTAVTWGPGVIYLGHNERPEVIALRFDGTVDRVIRWAFDHVPVTDRGRVSFREDVLGSLRQPGRRPDYERWFADVPYPATQPAFRSLATDLSGRTWVETWAEDDRGNIRWLVFEPTGAMQAEVLVPSGLTLLDIGDDHVLTVWKDELDVEYARLYSLLK